MSQRTEPVYNKGPRIRVRDNNLVNSNVWNVQPKRC